MICNKKLNATLLKKGRVDCIFFASSSSSYRNISKHGIKLRQLENFNMCTTVKSIKRTMQYDL